MKFLWMIFISSSLQASVFSDYRPIEFALTRDYSWLKEKMLDPRIELTENGNQVLQLQIEGIPVCGALLKLSGTNFLSVLGEIPSTLGKALSSLDVDSGVVEQIVLSDYPQAERLTSEVCWEIVGESLQKMVKGSYELNGESFHFKYINQKLSVFPNRFDINATITAYPSRITSGVPTLYNITTTEEGYLTDSRLQASSFSSSGTIRYNEVTNNFNKSATVTDAEAFYDQSASFLYGARHFDFLKAQYNFDFYSTTPIQLVVGGTGAELNNAHFDPPAQPGPGGRIAIGIGQPPYLQNLGKDEDVVSHEIGHYVIFKWIYDVASTDSKILHEGLADFFVFDRTGDACLGESICPTGIKCVTSSCLRIGAVDFKYGDETWNKTSEIHKRGQLIATTLWNARQKLPAGVAGLVTYTALSKVSPNASIEQFLIAVLHAEADRFASVHRPILLAEMRNMGFSSWLVGAESNLPPIPTMGNKDPVVKPTTESSTEEKRWWKRKDWYRFGCSIGGVDGGAPLYLLILLIVPMIPSMFYTLRSRK
jgi:hypothetical protein